MVNLNGLQRSHIYARSHTHTHTSGATCPRTGWSSKKLQVSRERQTDMDDSAALVPAAAPRRYPTIGLLTVAYGLYRFFVWPAHFSDASTAFQAMIIAGNKHLETSMVSRPHFWSQYRFHEVLVSVSSEVVSTSLIAVVDS